MAFQEFLNYIFSTIKLSNKSFSLVLKNFLEQNKNKKNFNSFWFNSKRIEKKIIFKNRECCQNLWVRFRNKSKGNIWIPFCLFMNSIFAWILRLTKFTKIKPSDFLTSKNEKKYLTSFPRQIQKTNKNVFQLNRKSLSGS